jgi:hypothetical protein
MFECTIDTCYCYGCETRSDCEGGCGYCAKDGTSYPLDYCGEEGYHGDFYDEYDSDSFGEYGADWYYNED